MSVNWVMLDDGGGYMPLPGEQTLYQSPPRTTLSLQTSHRHSPAESYSQQCKSGVVYLTNRRIIYLPVSPTPTLQSFAVPILHVADSRVTAPWFGANKWEALIAPVSGGGIPSQHAELDMVMEFKEGGAFDFSSIFERLKERLRQAVDVARESGAGDEDGRGVDMNNVHLDELPRYEESGEYARVQEQSAPSVPAPVPTNPQTAAPSASPLATNFEPPDEAPPGYEEAQRDGVVEELERQARRMSND